LCGGLRCPPPHPPCWTPANAIRPTQVAVVVVAVASPDILLRRHVRMKVVVVVPPCRTPANEIRPTQALPPLQQARAAPSPPSRLALAGQRRSCSACCPWTCPLRDKCEK
jgi:hypothetical protein